MAFERIMGIEVINVYEYEKYRQSMLPILNSYGGSFGFDFEVNNVLKSKTEDAINRVFTIDFPSKEVMESFFNDPDYLAVKDKHFKLAVNSITTISLHEK